MDYKNHEHDWKLFRWGNISINPFKELTIEFEFKCECGSNKLEIHKGAIAHMEYEKLVGRKAAGV